MTTNSPSQDDSLSARPFPSADRRPSPSVPHRATVRCVTRLQGRYRRDNPAAAAALARLRRGVGRPAHDSPDSWGIDGLEDLAEVRQQLAAELAAQETRKFFSADERHKSERRERAEEEAVHLAVTLWALHQQSVRDADMHVSDWGLGRSARHLAHGRTGMAGPATGDGVTADGSQDKRSAIRTDDDLSETLRKRFVRIGTSNSFDALAVRLREMVLLLRTARIPLDYGRLAHQLYAWQNENLRAEVRRTWGREFHLSYEHSGRNARTDSAVAGNGATEEPDTSSPTGEDQSGYADDMYDSGE
ncbi:hypothetical protein GCM10009654_15530 [Streptomyces hebeiensis]|uniref:Type I-E CRISPR-associated protein Cse2/CasB n=1 Tax=Streptomyces hebeiensis TaxID=229486 RepID=A0ABN1UNB4_9ACTN